MKRSNQLCLEWFDLIRVVNNRFINRFMIDVLMGKDGKDDWSV